MTASDGICEICGKKRAFFKDTPEGQICIRCGDWHCIWCMDWEASGDDGRVCLSCGNQNH